MKLKHTHIIFAMTFIWIVLACLGYGAYAGDSIPLEAARSAAAQVQPPDPAAAEAHLLNVADAAKALIALIFSAIGGFVLWVVNKISKLAEEKLKVDINEKHRAALQEVIEEGLQWAEGYAQAKASQWQPDVKNQHIATAANYVLDHVPDAVDALGLSREKIVRMVEAKLGVQRERETPPAQDGGQPEEDEDETGPVGPVGAAT